MAIPSTFYLFTLWDLPFTNLQTSRLYTWCFSLVTKINQFSIESCPSIYEMLKEYAYSVEGILFTVVFWFATFLTDQTFSTESNVTLYLTKIEQVTITKAPAHIHTRYNNSSVFFKLHLITFTQLTTQPEVYQCLICDEACQDWEPKYLPR